MCSRCKQKLTLASASRTLQPEGTAGADESTTSLPRCTVARIRWVTSVSSVSNCLSELAECPGLTANKTPEAHRGLTHPRRPRVRVSNAPLPRDHWTLPARGSSIPPRTFSLCVRWHEEPVGHELPTVIVRRNPIQQGETRFLPLDQVVYDTLLRHD